MTPPGRPAVSVVMPFYRDDRWFPGALASVLAQTHPPHEVIVVDDASGSDHARSLDAPPAGVRVIRLPANGGPGNARQVGTMAATGELLTYLDTDDLWPPDFLERCVAALERNPDEQAVYTAVAKRYPDGTRREYGDKPARLDVREALVRFHAFPSVAMVFRRAAIVDIGGWDPSPKGSEDWDLLVRFLDRFGTVGFVPGVFVEYRVQHSASRRSARSIRRMRAMLHSFRKNRSVLERHYGRSALRRRFSQVLHARADAESGLYGRLFRVAGILIGPPLDRGPVND